jgi:hypothetical protein
VHDASALVLEHEKHEQDTKRGCRHDKEIDGNEVLGVVLRAPFELVLLADLVPRGGGPTSVPAAPRPPRPRSLEAPYITRPGPQTQGLIEFSTVTAGLASYI